MKKTHLAFFSFLVLLSIAARAGDKEGNGGDAVVCFKSEETKKSVERILRQNAKNPNQATYPLDSATLKEITSVEILDLFLINQIGIVNPKKVASFPKENNFQAIVNDRMDLIRRKSSLFYLLKRVQEKMSDRNWISSTSGVLEIDDSQHVINFPKNCILLQLARQDSMNDLVQISYDKNLFDLMNVTHQAALFYHEWGQFLNSGKLHPSNDNYIPDTRSVHRLVGDIFSEDFSNLSPEDFNQDLNQTNLRNLHTFKKPSFFRADGISIFGTSVYTEDDSIIYLYEPANLAGIHFAVGSEIERSSMENGLRLNGAFLRENTPLSPGRTIKENSWIYFDKNKKIETATFVEDQDTDMGLTFLGGERMDLDSSGRIISGVSKRDYLWREQNLTFMANKPIGIFSQNTPDGPFIKGTPIDLQKYRGLPLRFGHEIGVYLNGNLKYAKLSKGQRIQNIDCKADHVYFYESGILRCCQLEGSQKFQVRNETIRLLRDTYQYFYNKLMDSGKPVPQSVYLDDDSCIWLQDIYINTASNIEFHENGRIKRAYICGEATIHGRFYSQGSALLFNDKGRVIGRE